MFGGLGPHGAYTVTIAADGSVRATGNGGLARVGVPRLSPSQLASLNRSATAAHFGSLPPVTRCPGVTPSTTTWIHVGTRKVSVAGPCVSAYQRLLKAFVAATRFFMSP
jgi:hypothetical protein